MGTQQRLPGVRVAPSTFSVTCSYNWRVGWSARLATPGDVAGVYRTREYDGLTADELLDVLASEVAQLLAAGTDY